jgi:hypothetical protein
MSWAKGGDVVPGKWRRESAITRLGWLAVAALALCGCASASSSSSSSSSPAGGPGTSASPSTSSSDSPAASTSRVDGPIWQLKWQTDFAEPAPVGSFSDCNNYDRTPDAYCSGLPASLRSQWWAYPTGWPDSATEVHLPVGGYYDPGHTVSISGGLMHIRMFRANGSIHSAAVVPKAAIGLLYGKYVERFRVADPGSSAGYKGSHLLWPTSNQPKYEVDFPEGPWDSDFCVHVHAASEGSATKDFCPTGATWANWNTTAIEWWPNNLAFYLNGTEIYHITGKWVPDQRMSWIIQNETSLNGQVAPENSSAQLDISYVGVYTYAGEKT